MVTIGAGPGNSLVGVEDDRFVRQMGVGRALRDAARSWTAVALGLVCTALVVPVGPGAWSAGFSGSGGPCVSSGSVPWPSCIEGRRTRSSSGTKSARALVVVYARHDAVRRNEVFIGARLPCACRSPTAPPPPSPRSPRRRPDASRRRKTPQCPTAARTRNAAAPRCRIPAPPAPHPEHLAFVLARARTSTSSTKRVPSTQRTDS